MLATATTTQIYVSSQLQPTDRLIQMWLFGKSDSTKKSYLRIVNRFFDFCGVWDIRDVSLGHLQDWSKSLDGLKSNTIRSYMATVKSLITFSHKLGYLPANPGVMLKTPKAQDAATLRFISVDQVREMIKEEVSDRDRLILKTLFQCGLRAEELCQLQWKDLTLGCFQVLGKGQKLRSVPVNPSLLNKLESLRGGELELIFPGRQGKMTRQRVWQIVKSAAKKIGLNNPSPHWLRHGYAFDCKLNGTDDRDLQNVMGHSSLSTTSRYGQALNRGQVKQSVF